MTVAAVPLLVFIKQRYNNTHHMTVTRNFHSVNVKNVDNFLERYDHYIKKIHDDGRRLCGDKVRKTVEGCETNSDALE